MRFNFFPILVIILLVIPLVSAAHYIVGIVNDALDGTLAEDHEVVLWNPNNGINDNVTDTIGVNGNSKTNNIYMIDCELLNESCVIGDNLSIRVINNGDGYITGVVNATVTSAGYDIAPNLTLNSPPNLTSVSVDDSIVVPENEIDLIAASNRTVTCEAIVEEFDGDNLQNINSEFFHSSSFYGDSDDNNTHYTNDSCYLNSSYGDANENQIICQFYVWYYASSGQWNCTIRVEDNLSTSGIGSDTTNVNSLLSIGVGSTIDFGSLDSGEVSEENVTNVTNFGNIMVNLSLKGYGVSEGDGYAMSCDSGSNISVYYEKYNLTSSNPGVLTFSDFEVNYTNLTSNAAVKKFNLDYRKNEGYNEATKETYWRIYVPAGVGGTCNGSVVFGASTSIES
ncbi:hypothetical protein GF386_06485 [Candidatus Pacearchaeota archaeon]|nr:hypothetical protein [Candidatus Pacearchaeota archaeon]MBD3283739.1 hypothetical protein [Candidatus Pacearchaeota archaeon]